MKKLESDEKGTDKKGADKKSILLFSPRQWDLQWGQEKDLVDILKDSYHVTICEFMDYLKLKKVYTPFENTTVVYRKTNLKPGVLFGLVSEWRCFKDTLKYKHDIMITYLTAGTLLASLFDRMRGKKILLIYADDMPELHKHSSFLAYWFTKHVFNPLSALLSSEIIVTAKLLQGDIAYFGKKPVYVPNGVNLDKYVLPKGVSGENKSNKSKDVSAKNFSKKNNVHATVRHSETFHSKGKFVLGFVGGFGKWVDFDMVLDYAKNNPSTDVWLIGDGEQFNYVKDKIKSYDLKNVKLTGMIPKDKVREYMVQMDACIIPFKVNRLTDRVSPIKLFEYWSMGKPVISTGFYEVKEMGAGIVLFIKDANELASVIDKLKTDNNYRKKIIDAGLKKVVNYDWKVLGKKYLSALEKLK